MSAADNDTNVDTNGCANEPLSGIFARSLNPPVTVINHRIKSTVYAKHFDVVSATPDGKGQVACQFVLASGDICNEKLSLQQSTYANLKRHLKNLHGLDICDRATRKPQGLQLTLEQLKEKKTKYPRNHPKQTKHDFNVLRMYASDLCPFDIVSYKGFRGVLTGLDEKLNLKSRTAYMKKLKCTVKREIIPKIKARLQKVEKRFCHFSLDIWTTRRMEAVLCILVHYIDDEWKLKREVILFEALNQRHTAVYIRNVFLQCLATYGVPSNWGGVVVTDNAKNMVKAFNMSDLAKSTEWLAYFRPPNANLLNQDDWEESDSDTENESLASDEDEDEDSDEVEDEDDFSEEFNTSQVLEEFSTALFNPETDLPISGHIGCAAHTLQLAINGAINSDSNVKDMLSYVNQVMVFFKKSTVYRDQLRAMTDLNPMTAVKTRWNCSLFILQRFLSDTFYEAARNILDRVSLNPQESRRRNTPISPSVLVRRKAQELHSLLHPLGIATDILQADGPTSNLLIINVINAFRKVKSLNVLYYASFQRATLLSLKDKMEGLLSKEEYLISAFLDPRIKTTIFQLSWGPEGEIKLDVPNTHHVTAIVRRLFNEENPGRIVAGGLPSQQDGSEDNGHDLFGIVTEGIAASVAAIRDEIDQYLEEPVSSFKTCPLNYWKCNKDRLKTLSCIARKYLSIPATSAGVERMFSISGAIGRASRASISTKNMSNLLMFRSEYCGK